MNLNAKMIKIKDLLSSKEAVDQLQISLEKKTEKAFSEISKLKRGVKKAAHQKYLD